MKKLIEKKRRDFRRLTKNGVSILCLVMMLALFASAVFATAEESSAPPVSGFGDRRSRRVAGKCRRNVRRGQRVRLWPLHTRMLCRVPLPDLLRWRGKRIRRWRQRCGGSSESSSIPDGASVSGNDDAGALDGAQTGSQQALKM